MVWFSDFELPRPLIKNERTTRNKKREIIMISNPINPAGTYKVFKNLITIRQNRMVENMSGNETIWVNANAETKGIVTR